MPSFNLRGADETLDAFAVSNVLAVMCFPADRARREAMLATVPRVTGQGTARRRPLSYEQFRTQLSRSIGRGMVAGRLLLNMLQVSENGGRPSLNLATRLLLPLLPDWVQPMPHIWPDHEWRTHYPRSKSKMLDAYKEFRPVAHLWAAFFHAYSWSGDDDVWGQDMWPGSPETLPEFLGYADNILEKASRMRMRGARAGFALRRSEAWTFILPAHLRRAKRLIPLPLNDEQRAIINDGRRANRLK